ncbi:siderophore-interacting protein [Nocardioides sp. YIM 152315]|uniref:siderophore-interacting protein n=1 Tax=Nocardioides sp. YIM 152315 TaxID=3031760 RepID=UPI0023DCDEBD|nr:siderophore-interacting protein [Nocardioides sp. YIM 152315]MDF1602010.1 siderophore-interacting protein [Nocardioides sp. YIM 152315]
MPTWHGQVESTEWLTPALVRVVLGGDGLGGFAMPDATDTYVNVAIPPSGAPYSGAFSPADVKEQHDREHWPVRRRYTVRSWDAATGRLTLDFVVHGDHGVGGPWAGGTRVGDVLVFEGPGSGYRPDPAADWHLLVGDESALPAIAASLEAIPAGTAAVVRLVCDGPEHEIALPCPGDLDLVWLHRTGAEDDVDLLPDAVADLVFPTGRVHAFIHGEADEIRAIRRHLLSDRGLDRATMSCSPYWRRTMTDEAWRAVKRDYVAAMDAEVA